MKQNTLFKFCIYLSLFLFNSFAQGAEISGDVIADDQLLVGNVSLLLGSSYSFQNLTFVYTHGNTVYALDDSSKICAIMFKNGFTSKPIVECPAFSELQCHNCTTSYNSTHITWCSSSNCVIFDTYTNSTSDHLTPTSNPGISGRFLTDSTFVTFNCAQNVSLCYKLVKPCPDKMIHAGLTCTQCSQAFIPDSTQNECVLCTDGYYEAHGRCFSCEPGFYCNTGSKKPCPAGEYSQYYNTPLCELCPVNQYCPNTNTSSPIPCSLSEYAIPGSKSCTSCGPDKIRSSMFSTSCVYPKTLSDTKLTGVITSCSVLAATIVIIVISLFLVDFK